MSAARTHTVLSLASAAALAILVVAGSAGGARGKPDKEPPTAPANIAVAEATPTSVTLTWDASTDNVGVAGYYVYVNAIRARVSGTRYTASGLECGTSAAVRVVAFDSSRNVSAAAEATVSTAACPDLQPPTAPDGFRQAATTQTAVVLEWDASSDNVGVVSYGVFRDSFPMDSTPTPSFALSGLECGTTYRLDVDAADAAGNRSPRSAAWVSTADCSDAEPPTVPTDLQVTARTLESLTLSWSASSDNVGVVGYRVSYGGKAVADVAETTAKLEGLQCGSVYVISVDAYDAAGNRSPATTVVGETETCPPPPTPPGPPGSVPPSGSADTSPPSAPANLGIAGTTRTSVSLSWSASSDNVGVAGYGVYVDGSHVLTAGQPGATLSELACGKAYTFSVDAFDGAGNRSGRTSVTGSTSPCADTQAPTAPTNVVATSRTTTSIALSWSASSDNVGVTGYGLYRGGSLVGTSTGTTGIFANLACNTSYTLAVDAVDAAANRSTKTTVMVSTTACADTTPPSAPTGLAASNVSQTGLTLTWGASSDNVGVTGYDVFRNGTLITTVTSTSSAQSGLACGTSYWFGVEARDAAGNRSARAQINPSTSACSTPPPPTDWTFCANEGQRCTFSGTMEVRYGANGTYTQPRAFSDGVSCTNDVFGDPLVGVGKHCQMRTTGSNPPPPPPSGGTITITQGGTYTGNWASTSSTPAVRISTSQPVTIRDSAVTNLAGGDLIRADAGSNVTIERVTAHGGGGRFFVAEGIKSVTIRNCTINKTGGIYLLSAQSGASVVITRNKQSDVQGAGGLRQFAQFDQVTSATIDVSWNQVINGFGQSLVEDNISLHRTANAKIHDNYIQGAYPSSAGAGYSGSGIMIEGAESGNNEIYGNQIVETTNAGIGVASGFNNKIHHNRLIFDGRLDDGTRLSAANVGIYVWNSSNLSNFSGNDAWTNTVGWVNGSGQRNDWWMPDCSGSCQNSSYSGTVTLSVEQAEYQAWLGKLSANGITVGA